VASKASLFPRVADVYNSVSVKQPLGKHFMLVETDNLVTADAFQRDFQRFVEAAGKGSGPVAITRDSRVVGVFMSPAEYDALFGAAVRKLLKSREKGPTVSHDDVRKRSEQIIKRRRTADQRGERG
jgi:PHD/YefM family antitoxin component YafN of YafNO toxin-antitoxin module